jgi:8-amino-7-oxononanoate synthase
MRLRAVFPSELADLVFARKSRRARGVESEAAAYFGAETALYFGGGYVANFAIFSTLPQRGDLVVHDELVHASVHEGLRSGRADHVAVAHNDIDAFDASIVRWRARGGKGRPWISVESLYSMDGDSPDLAGLLAVADRHEAMIVIDEAHATGCLGPQGRDWLLRARGARMLLLCIHAARRLALSEDLSSRRA